MLTVYCSVFIDNHPFQNSGNVFIKYDFRLMKHSGLICQEKTRSLLEGLNICQFVNGFVLYCTYTLLVLYCTVLCCTVLYCIVLHCTVIIHR